MPYALLVAALGRPRAAEPPDYGEWVMSTFTGTVAPTAGRFFVDLAANHPKIDSNTYGLEKQGWKGLCIEPNPEYVNLLREQRTCSVIPHPVDSTEHGVTFEFDGPKGGIVDKRFDNRAKSGKRLRQLVTRTLDRVLRDSSAPRVIDFLSLDVEGAETAVLHPSFAWSEYTFLTLIIERPPPDLNARLFAHGYLFVQLFNIADVCYVHMSHPRAATIARNASFVQTTAKCKNHNEGGAKANRYSERPRITGIHCPSMFGCCEFPGYPQRNVSYMGKAVPSLAL